MREEPAGTGDDSCATLVAPLGELDAGSRRRALCCALPSSATPSFTRRVPTRLSHPWQITCNANYIGINY